MKRKIPISVILICFLCFICSCASSNKEETNDEGVEQSNVLIEASAEPEVTEAELKISNDVIAEYGNSPGNIINGGYVISNNNTIFFVHNPMNSSGNLYKYDIANDKTSFIMDNCYGNLDIKDDKLFFSNKKGIFSCDFDGENIEQYYHSRCPFIIGDDSIYLIDNYIFKIDILTNCCVFDWFYHKVLSNVF